MEGCVENDHTRNGNTGDNSATVAGAGDTGRSEHGRAEEAVKRGVGKGVTAGKAA